MTKAMDELLADIPTTTELLRLAVLERAIQQGAKPLTERGQQFYDWHGDIYEVLRGYRSDLPKQPDDGDKLRLWSDLLPKMRHQDAALRHIVDARMPLRSGEMRVGPVWRVRADPNDSPLSPPTPANQEDTPHAPAPAATPSESAPATTEEAAASVKYVKCPVCVFTDTPASVGIHKNKLAARPADHDPDASALPCPIGGCPVVRTTPDNYKAHLLDAHPEEYPPGSVMCKKIECLQWFEDMSKYRNHRKEEHPETLKRSHRAPVKPAKTPAVKEPVTVVPAEPAPAAVVTERRFPPAAPAAPDPAREQETPAEAAVRLLTEYPTLKEEVVTLKEANAKLTSEVMDLRMKVREGRRALQAFRRKVDALLSDG